MTENEFVKKFAELAPSIKKMISWGYSVKRANRRNKRYFLERKTPKNAVYDNPLVRLICNYDTSHFEVGMVTLGKKESDFLPETGKIHVGNVEADILVINPDSGNVELLDHGQPSYVMAICAKSGSQFLDALMLLAEYEVQNANYSIAITKEQEIAKNEEVRKQAAKCAKAAGIMTPPNIYEMLLGYECSTT